MSGAASSPASPEEQLAALVAQAAPAVQSYACALTQARYLTAHCGRPAEALAGLEATVAWRASAIQPGFACALCREKPGAHCFISLGQDDEGDALIYGAPARASEGGEVPGTVAHCVNSLEKQWGAGGAAPQRWSWVVDFRDFGFTHAMQARLGISFATIFKAHFPERLKRILLLNPPTLFKVLVSAIGVVADARTLAKLVVLEAPGPAELCQRLRAEHGVGNAEVQAWLLAAFTEPTTPGTLPPVPAHLAHLQV